MTNIMQMITNLSIEMSKDRAERQEQMTKDKGKSVVIEGESSRPYISDEATQTIGNRDCPIYQTTS